MSAKYSKAISLFYLELEEAFEKTIESYATCNKCFYCSKHMESMILLDNWMLFIQYLAISIQSLNVNLEILVNIPLKPLI